MHNAANLRYRYLLFDIDNTLMDFSAGEKVALFQTMEELDTPISDAEYRDYLAINAGVWTKFEQGLLDSRTVQRLRFEQFLERLSLDPARAQFVNDRYVENLGRQAIVMDGAIEMLRRLKARYEIAVITNGLHLVQRARLERSGFLPLLGGVYISQEMGVQKPSKAYFDAVCEAFGETDRSRYLVIGDSLSADIQGGINAGIDTCWLKPAGAEARADVPPTYTVGGYGELLGLLLP
ncbi:MAG: YjjG family noncanonical pyrimidine nucleotidase [Eubacteriales bacterium]|nr:YjjG family noncanonical pyrimidine nucleotidase [Eubacteriales bacterium]